MSSSYTSKNLRVLLAKNFKDSFRENCYRKVGYVFLSKSSAYPNENVASEIVDSVDAERKIWDEMILAKRVVPKDFEFVIPRYNWTSGNRYKQYDDTVPLEDLLTESEDDEGIIYPMYAINPDGDVYKCISNNGNSPSINEPTGKYTENDGFIQTETGDEETYIWKYMYNVKLSNKFLNTEWLPVPYIEANTQYTEYTYGANSVISGTLNTIVVANSGSNYVHTNLTAQPFVAGTNEILIVNNIDLPTSNTLKLNMKVSGTGIAPNETYIAQINPAKPKTLILSTPTIGAGGGNALANLVSVSTRVVIEGDGSNTITSVKLANNSIQKINVLNAGVGYTRANVIIYGSGTGASARAILPPGAGHSYNPVFEFGASNIMVVNRIGELDATENNSIPVNIDFRQYGFLINPHKYGEDVPMEFSNSLSIVSQTLDLTLLNPSNYIIGEKVYQGTSENPTFTGNVVYQNSNVVKLNNVYKTANVGTSLIGSQSLNTNQIVSIKNPDLKRNSGHIVFTRNILKVQRSLAQAEEVKLVFQF